MLQRDITADIALAPDRPWPIDEGLLQTTGLVLNQDPVLLMRGRDENYFEQLRAEVPSVGAAVDARRRRVTGAAMETVPGVEGDRTAEMYADFIRSWRAYVGQGNAPSWKGVISAMWHAAAWGWRPARLSWVGIPGASVDVRPFEFNGRTGWRVPWRVQPLEPHLYAWTAEHDLVEMTMGMGGGLEVARIIGKEIDATSHWHVRAGATASPYGVGFMRYAEGPAYARRLMWARYQSGVNMAMGGWMAERESVAMPAQGAGQVATKGNAAGHISALVSAFRLLDEARVFVKPDGWDLKPIEQAAYTSNWLEGIRYIDQFLSVMIRGSLVAEIGGSASPGSRAAAETLTDGLEGAVAKDDAEFLCEHIRKLDRCVLEANFGRIPDAMVPKEIIHAGPRAPTADVVALAGASAAAGIEPDWATLYTSMGVTYRTVDALTLDDSAPPTQPVPIAGVGPRGSNRGG